MKKDEKCRKIVRILRRLFPEPKIALKYSNEWELLVAVILSAQCTDKKVNQVTEHLFKKYRDVDAYATASLEEFMKDIYSTGFFRSKATHIIASAKRVRDHYDGTVPRTMAEMLTLAGVGRKTANVVLGNAFGVVEGIAVDTHVRRLARLLGLTKESDPDKIERDLLKCVARKDWLDFNHMLVEYGRRYCPARPHNHASCPLMKVL